MHTARTWWHYQRPCALLKDNGLLITATARPIWITATARLTGTAYISRILQLLQRKSTASHLTTILINMQAVALMETAAVKSWWPHASFSQPLATSEVKSPPPKVDHAPPDVRGLGTYGRATLMLSCYWMLQFYANLQRLYCRALATKNFGLCMLAIIFLLLRVLQHTSAKVQNKNSP